MFLHKNGVKVDYLTDRKQENMQKYIKNGGNYYPTDTAGVIDEWAALARQQDNLWNQKMEQDKAEKRIRVRIFDKFCYILTEILIFL